MRCFDEPSLFRGGLFCHGSSEQKYEFNPSALGHSESLVAEDTGDQRKKRKEQGWKPERKYLSGAAMILGVVLARAVRDSRLSDEILQSVRQKLS